MSMLWPTSLLLLTLIPVSIAAYIWALRRRQRFAIRYSNLALVRAALPQQSRLRRHLPFAFLLAALACLVLALARPVTVTTVPDGQATIMLALDVSRSMCSTDIEPNRLQAAKKAASLFVDRQQSSTQIGVVAFAGYAEIVQMPTNDQEILQDVLDSLITGRRTAIGSAILKSIDAIAEIDPNVSTSTSRADSPAGPNPVAPGAYAPAIIVLLTDGASNAGAEPLDAAQQAVDRGIRVYTIGFGTAQGAERPMDCGDGFYGGPYGGGARPIPDDPGSQYGGGGFYGGGQYSGFGGFRRGIDEETLKQIADTTGGEYYAAESAGELQQVFEKLPTYLVTRHETIEVSFVFSALGAILAGLAVTLALRWQPL